LNAARDRAIAREKIEEAEQARAAEIRHAQIMERSQRKYSKICQQLKDIANQYKIEVVVNGRIY